jgi:hypothetical protein
MLRQVLSHWATFPALLSGFLLTKNMQDILIQYAIKIPNIYFLFQIVFADERQAQGWLDRHTDTSQTQPSLCLIYIYGQTPIQNSMILQKSVVGWVHWLVPTAQEFEASLGNTVRHWPKRKTKLAHTCNPTTWEAEIRRIVVQGQPWQIIMRLHL